MIKQRSKSGSTKRKTKRPAMKRGVDSIKNLIARKSDKGIFISPRKKIKTVVITKKRKSKR